MSTGKQMLVFFSRTKEAECGGTGVFCALEPWWCFEGVEVALSHRDTEQYWEEIII